MIQTQSSSMSHVAVPKSLFSITEATSPNTTITTAMKAPNMEGLFTSMLRQISCALLALRRRQSHHYLPLLPSPSANSPSRGVNIKYSHHVTYKGAQHCVHADKNQLCAIGVGTKATIFFLLIAPKIQLQQSHHLINCVMIDMPHATSPKPTLLLIIRVASFLSKGEICRRWAHLITLCMGVMIRSLLLASASEENKTQQPQYKT